MITIIILSIFVIILIFFGIEIYKIYKEYMRVKKIFKEILEPMAEKANTLTELINIIKAVDSYNIDVKMMWKIEFLELLEKVEENIRNS